MRLFSLIVALSVAAVPFAMNDGAAAEQYDLTNCSSATITPIATGQDLTAFVVDAKGIARSSADKKAFDNNSFHCVTLVKMSGGQRSGHGICRFLDPDGDAVVGEQVLGPTDGNWTFLEGTGKWKGIKGGGKFSTITSAKPIVAGTGQGCGRATGSYEIVK